MYYKVGQGLDRYKIISCMAFLNFFAKNIFMTYNTISFIKLLWKKTLEPTHNKMQHLIVKGGWVDCIKTIKMKEYQAQIS